MENLVRWVALERPSAPTRHGAVGPNPGPGDDERRRSGHTGSVHENDEPTYLRADPNDSRTWPRWMTVSVLVTGVVGVVVMILLVRG